MLSANVKNYLLLGAALLIVCALLWVGRTEAHTNEDIARAIVATCAPAGTDEDPAPCYEDLVPKLYPERPVNDVFAVMRQIRQLDRTYQFCHVLAHKLGERVVAEDPSRWMNAMALNPPDGLCSNGFVHGVVGGRFRAEVLTEETIQGLISDFTRACAPREDWSPSDLDRAICYHGMGHLYDFITDADIPQALALCAQTTPKDYARTCTEGVFMQIYQPLEPDDYLLIERMQSKPSTTTVRAYCATYGADPEVEGACLRESWPYMSRGIRDGTAVATFCSGQPDAQRTDDCYQTVSSLVGRMSLDDPNKAAAACGNFPPERQATCYNYSAQAILEENRTDAVRAVALCAQSGPSERSCYEFLVSHAVFLFGGNRGQLDAFCAALPKDLSMQCHERAAMRSSAPHPSPSARL